MKRNNEQIILEVARKQFVKNGYAATRTEEIAQEAGLTKAMVHYYFRTKEKLFDEIVRKIFANSMVNVGKAIDGDGDIWDRIERVVETYISTLLKEPDIPFFMMYELSQKRESFIAQIEKHRAKLPGVVAFVQEIQTEMEEGRWRSMPPLQVLLTIISMTVFPFIAKPVFNTVLEFPEESFTKLMEERKAFILDFLKNALIAE